MKKTLFVALGLSLLLPQFVYGGVLYGTARNGQAPVANAKISLACPGFDKPGPKSALATTDARGSFSLRVEATGRCEMRVEQNNRTGRIFEVIVSNNPLRFDVELDGAMNRVR